MSALMMDPTTATLLALVAKVTLLVGMAALAVVLGGRLSAAARHWTITLAVCGLLGLPFLSSVLPSWTVAAVRGADLASAPPAPASAPSITSSASTAPAPVRTESLPAHEVAETAVAAGRGSSNTPSAMVPMLVAGYAAIAVLLLLRVARQLLTARRLVRQSHEIAEPGWQSLLADGRALLGVKQPVRLLHGGLETMPMAIGTVRPAIVLPAIGDEWTVERRRAVLLHELAHVGRRDCLTQLLAAVACAIYWPHPGVWWLARRLRVERELACDDLVLRAGTPATDYAGHLLDVAYTFGGTRSNALAVGMARRSQLEGRMLAVLDAARNRTLPGPRLRMAMAAVAMVALVPLAVATVSSEPLVSVSIESAIQPTASATEPRQPALLKQDLKPAPWAGVVAAAVEQASGLVSRGSGSWSLAPSQKPGEVYLEMREGRSNSGMTVALSLLEGLTESQLAGSGPVKFAVRRDAGTFAFEGTVRDGHGGGTYSFTANQAFPAELEKRGIGRPTASEQYEMARHDVGLALADELATRGYARPTVAELVKAGHHGVRADYVREMADLGYAVGTIEALITLRDHGVTPGFARGLAAQGFTKIPVDELRRVRDHGVTPDFIAELKALGYTLSLAEYVKVRDHGVTPQYVSEMRALGYSGLPIDAVVNARDHGVTPDYVKGLADQGHAKLSLDEVVKTRDHGVTPDYVRQMHELGHKAPLPELVRARDHGVTPDYARGLKALGYDNLPLAELITLRDHGVTPDKVKRANEKAGTKLPADMLRSLASHGWK
jgi:beta-lactamase regulating signal transducer with metallopeptidase domain